MSVLPSTVTIKIHQNLVALSSGMVSYYCHFGPFAFYRGNPLWS